MEISREGSLSATSNDRPVIVRMKRKSSQSPLDAFCGLRHTPAMSHLNFDNLSIADSSRRIGEVGVQRLLVRHVESSNTSGTKPELLQSFEQLRLTESSAGNDNRSDMNKKEDTSEELLIKERETRQSCEFYDVIRLDDLQEPGEMKPKTIFRWLREFVPTVAARFEHDISACTVDQGALDDYVYDLYAVNACMDECVENPPGEFPLVQVEDGDDHSDGPDETELESEQSNGEDNPKNDYPEQAWDDELLSEDLARDGGGEGEGGESGDVTCSEFDDLDIDIALEEDFTEGIRGWGDGRCHDGYY